MASDHDWTAEAVAQLRTLWTGGHATAAIGRRMGISKNAVIGKAHRLGLPPRPSPIRAKGSGERPHARARLRPREPSLAPVCLAMDDAPHLPPERPPRLATTLPASPARAASPPPPPAPDKPAAPDRPALPRPALRYPCCWPIGEPGRPGFRFCDAGAMPRKPYCAEHAGTAYVEPEAARDRPGVRSLDRSLRRGLTRTP